MLIGTNTCNDNENDENHILVIRNEKNTIQVLFEIREFSTHYKNRESITTNLSNFLEAATRGVKKGVLKNFVKFIGKHLWQGLFFNKVAGQLFNNTFFTEHLWTTASDILTLNSYVAFTTKQYRYCKVVQILLP